MVIKNNGLGQRINDAMAAKKIWPAELARKSGLTPAAICQIQAGRATSLTSAMAIARALNVRLDWLTSGEGEMDAGSAEGLSDRAKTLAKEFDGAPPEKQETLWRLFSAVMALSLLVFLAPIQALGAKTTKSMSDNVYYQTLQLVVGFLRRMYENLRPSGACSILISATV